MLFATTCTLALVAFSSITSSWEFEIPSLLQTQWILGWISSTQSGISLEDPSRNHIKAYQITKKPILFSTSPNDPFESPRLSRLNSTAWEQWYFDSVSNTGSAGLTMCFSRDPSYEFFGNGNLRVEIDIVWDNGTRFSQVDFAAESVVEALESTTRGTWNGPGIDYSFEINNNLQHVKVTIDTPNVKGAFTIVSKTPPQYADGSIYPSENASMSSTTFLHWVEAIPVGLFEVDLMIGEAPFTFTGIGGHDRIWAAFNWITMVQGWHMIRAAIGPYSLTYWEPKEQKSGLKRPSAFLAKNGQRVFSAQTDRISQTKSYAIFSKLEGGHLHGGLEDNATAYKLDFVAPSEEKHWTFTLEHKNIEYELGTGGGSGLTGFVGTATGGELGNDETKFSGVGCGEQAALPKDSLIFISNYK